MGYCNKPNPMTSSLNIKILIAFHYLSDTIEKTVESILAATIPDDTTVTLVLVENGKKQRYKQIFKSMGGSFPIGICYLYHPKTGKSKALNVAIKAFDNNDFILFTDDDIVVNSEWIVKYSRAVKKSSGNFIFGGASKCYFEKKPSPDIAHLLPISARGTSDSFFKKDSRLFLGCNWGCYSDSIVRVGFFDEHLGPGTNATGQESDMQRRLMQIGFYKCIVPDNYVIHYVPEEKSDWTFIKGRIKKNMNSKKRSNQTLLQIAVKEIYRLFSNLKKSKTLNSVKYSAIFTFLRMKALL